MTSTATIRGAGFATILGGIGLFALGLDAIVDHNTSGSIWFAAAAAAISLLVFGVFGLERSGAAGGGRVATVAFRVAGTLLFLFAAAHLMLVFLPDAADAVLTPITISATLALTLAGIAVLRSPASPGPLRWLPLLVGVWQPAGVAVSISLGFWPPFPVIAGWGLCWAALGAAIVAVSGTRSAAIRPAATSGR